MKVKVVTLQSSEAPNSANTPAPAAEEQKVVPGEEQEAPKDVAKPEGEGEPKPEPTEVEKVKSAMQKRIDRQTAATRAQQEQIRQLTEQVAQLNTKAPKADDTPKEDDFESYDDWQKAVIKHEAKKQADDIVKGQKEEQLKAAQEKQAAEVKKEFDGKETAFRTTTPDYDQHAREAVQTMTELGQAGANISLLRDVVMQFDNPPEMIYQLGKDTSLIETLVGLPPLQMMRELVKFETAFKSATATPREEAPEPIKSVNGKGGVKPLHERSGEDIKAWLNSK